MVGWVGAARLAAGAATVVLAGAAAGFAPAARAQHTRQNGGEVALSSLEYRVLQDINSFRHAHHLSSLRISVALTQAADQHSHEMAAKGYFSHNSANGAAFWQRIERYYGAHDWSYWSVGENLLWASPDVSAARALRMWENSPEHRANLLTPGWRQIGISAVHVASAPGTYQGLGVTIVTTDFGVRR